MGTYKLIIAVAVKVVSDFKVVSHIPGDIGKVVFIIRSTSGDCLKIYGTSGLYLHSSAVLIGIQIDYVSVIIRVFDPFPSSGIQRASIVSKEGSHFCQG